MTSPTMLRIVAPTRLHFGLLSPGESRGCRFGGVGLMIESPAVEAVFRPAASFDAVGAGAERIRAAADCWSAFFATPLPPCQVAIQTTARLHHGLGVGTQVALAVAKGLAELSGNAVVQQAIRDPATLAASAGRGQRSAVGTHGFCRGGLIAETGRDRQGGLGRILAAVSLPAAWRVLVVCPPELAGFSGEQEQAIFRALAAAESLSEKGSDLFAGEGLTPLRTGSDTARAEALWDELTMRLLPAAQTGDFAQFAASVTRYGRLSGEYFAEVQGGPYNGPRLTRLAAQLLEHGEAGVGQSSWGPAVFAICRDGAAAVALRDRVLSDSEWRTAEAWITAASPGGAELHRRPDVSLP